MVEIPHLAQQQPLAEAVVVLVRQTVLRLKGLAKVVDLVAVAVALLPCRLLRQVAVAHQDKVTLVDLVARVVLKTKFLVAVAAKVLQEKMHNGALDPALEVLAPQIVCVQAQEFITQAAVVVVDLTS
jgi:hypothetical protein